VRFFRIVAAIAFSAMVAAGCGSGSSTSYVAPTGPAVKTLSISARNFAFGPNKLTAPAGIIQFDLEGAEGIHDLVIQGIPGFHVEVSGSGSKASGKVTLKAGTYTFYCSVAGHRAQGMEGTVTVS